MICARNIITANFSGGGTSATTAPLWQWDYGQMLCITGIDLPAAFEVHFSTNKTGGVSTVAVGADGQVTIPNDLLTIGKNLNAWIYLSDAQGEGETEYSILIPVKARPMPETYDAEVTGEFDDVVRQVSEYAETAQTAADNAGASASAAATSASEAAASASVAESAKTAAETAQGNAENAQAAAETAAQTATQKAQQTAQDAAQAAQSKADAESAAQSAEAAQTGAESAKTGAETAAQGAAASASVASTSATSAGQAATSAAQSATAAAGSATTAQGAAQTATIKAGEASASATAANTAKTAAQTAQTGAETAATNAGQSASTATAKAAEAAQSATDAAASETAAEAAATRAEQAAASLTVDDTLSDTSTNPVENRVVTGAIRALQIEDTASGAIVSLTDGSANPIQSLSVSLSPIQEGSGDPSPDNIRPITGREAVTVVRTGKNLLPNTGESKTTAGVTWTKNADGTITVSGTATGYSDFEIGYAKVTSDMGMITLSGIGGTSNVNWGYITLRDANTESIVNLSTGSASASLTFDISGYPNANTVRVTIKRNNNVATSGVIKPQLELGSTATAYEPYDGQSVTVQLGQTVYGGSAEIISGQGQSTMRMVDLGALNWTYDSTHGAFYAATSSYPKKYGFTNIISSAYKARTATSGNNWNLQDKEIGGGNNSSYIYIKDTAYSTAADFKSAMNGVQACYEINSPVEFTTDPATLSTLKGQNNVWSDADSVEMTYIADPKLYIAQLTEPDADMVADANITSGHYFMVGNTLYLATANIASGANIVPGVNCTKTNLAAALNAINA